MKSLLLLLTWLLLPALASLPVPVNLSMDSVNFLHLLRWDVLPQTPQDTIYQVYSSENLMKWKLIGSTTDTFHKVKLDLYIKSNLAVQATFNGSSSHKSKNCTFMPYRQTVISAPVLSLSGCGNCIKVNVSLPRPDGDSGISDLQNIYKLMFTVWWKKRGGVKSNFKTENRSFRLQHLEEGTEYCVQVDTHINVNKQTEPSVWSCTFTSVLSPSTVPMYVGVAIFLLFVLAGLFFSALLGLYSSGFICKLKENLPMVFLAALNRGYTLTPEPTIFDQVYISPENHLRPVHNPEPHSSSEGAEPEEEQQEEEQEEEKEYVNRGAELPSSDRTGCHSATGDSGHFPVDADSEGGVTQKRLDQDRVEEQEEQEAKEGKEKQDAQTGLTQVISEQPQKEEKERVVCDSSGDVNLLTVKLAALLGEEAQEEDEEHEEEQEEKPEEQSLLDLSSIHIPVTDLTETKTQPSSEEEEEDEDEEFSGYMRHS